MCCTKSISNVERAMPGLRRDCKIMRIARPKEDKYHERYLAKEKMMLVGVEKQTKLIPTVSTMQQN